MIRAVTDTHAILWYIYNDPRLSVTAGALLDSAVQAGEEIAISAISLIEIAYLIEKNRIPQNALQRILAELNTPGTNLLEIPVNQTVAITMLQVNRQHIPEMPDRIIAATALLLGVPVISRDHKIQASTITTVW